MFDFFTGMTERFSQVYHKITAKKLTQAVLEPILKELQDTLLQADVPFHVVEDFLKKVSQDVQGEAYPKHLSAQQAFIKILDQRLIELLDTHKNTELEFKTHPTKILLSGLQGSGKTTTAAKLALWAIKKKKKVLLVSLDIYRPAARVQLEQLAKKVGADIAGMQEHTLDAILQDALKRSKYYDVLIVDTAGRMQVSQEMMDELASIATVLNPQECLYVLDCMAGQESLHVAQSFHACVPITGVVATKLDSDARGGAILGVKSELGCPIRFMSTGEHYEQTQTFSVFHPERIARRILGMGDVLTLIEQLESRIDKEKAEKMAEKLLQSDGMNFEDLKNQLEQMQDMMQQQGGISGLLQYLPGAASLKGMVSDERSAKELSQTLAIIRSMTPKERHRPILMQQGSRKSRVAQGAGLTLADVNKVIKHLDMMQMMMKKFKNKGEMMKMMQKFQQMKSQFPMGGAF